MKWFLIAIWLACAAVAEGATYYASPSGSGSTCSSGSPCTLGTGLTTACANGDTLLLKDGIYTERFITACDGIAGNPITISAENALEAIIQPGSVGYLALIKHSYLIISGIDFNGTNVAGNQGAFRFCGINNDCPTQTPPHDITIDNVIVRNTPVSGFHLALGQHDIIIKNSTVNDTGNADYWGECFYIGPSVYDDTQKVYNIQIYNNTLINCTENGIETKRATENVVIRNNVIHSQVFASDKGVGQTGRGNNGTIELGGRLHQVYGNLLYNNKGGVGALVVKGNAGHLVRNNVIYNYLATTTVAIRRQDYGGEWTAGQFPVSQVVHNTFYGMPSDAVGSAAASLVVENNLGITSGTTNVPSSTVGYANYFTDVAAGDFTLRTGSPAIK